MKPYYLVIYIIMYGNFGLAWYLQRYSCVPNVTMAPHVKEDKIILEQTLLESQPGGPSPTAHASPGGIRDKNIQQELVQRKPALNELVDNTTTSAGK